MKSILSLHQSKSIYQYLEFILKKYLYSFLWKDYYIFPPEVTLNATLTSYQYKIINKVLHLNKKTTYICLPNTQLCSFCKMEEETISHQFCFCTHMQDIWNQVQACLFHGLFALFTVNTTD